MISNNFLGQKTILAKILSYSSPNFGSFRCNPLHISAICLLMIKPQSSITDTPFSIFLFQSLYNIFIVHLKACFCKRGEKGCHEGVITQPIQRRS